MAETYAEMCTLQVLNKGLGSCRCATTAAWCRPEAAILAGFHLVGRRLPGLQPLPSPLVAGCHPSSVLWILPLPANGGCDAGPVLHGPTLLGLLLVQLLLNCLQLCLAVKSP